jgi:acyl-CoA dehydrogenase
MDGREAIEGLGYGREIFSAEHEAYRNTARRFFRSEVEPQVRQWERDGFFPAELFRKAGAAGLLCAAVPAEYSGAGGDLLHLMIFHEEHGYSPAGAALDAGMATDISAYAVLYAGTEEQKREWLPQFAAGEIIAELGLTESQSGSDPRSIQTSARRVGSDWVLSGAKMWISNGPILTDLIVVARVEKSLALFVVPMTTRGVTVSRPTELMLKGAGGVSEIHLDDVRVPARNRLGGEDEHSLSNALKTVTIGRLATSARMLAACELAYHMTVDFVKNRKAFGQRIFDFQNTQFKLAEMKTQLVAGAAFRDCLLRSLVAGTLDVWRC